MQFSCPQQSFSQGLQAVSKAINSNNTLPVLNNILIKTEGNDVVLVSTNLEIAIRVSISAHIDTEGGLTVPAKLITNYVGLLNKEDITISIDDRETLLVKSESSQSKIKGIAVDEFPLIPDIIPTGKFLINSKILLDMISKTVFAASTNLARPVLSGVLFDLQVDAFKMVATDSYRLSETTHTLIDPIEKPLNCIIPSRTINELGKILSKFEDEDTEIIFAQNQILFKVGNIELISRLIEGQFPDYEKIIPSEKQTEISVDVDEFTLAVKKVNLFVPDNNCIKLEINNGVMKLFTDETQIGEGTEELHCETQGEQNSIALNSQFLLDILQVLEKGNAHLEMNDKLSPIVITSKKGDGFIHIIMPLKV